MSEMLRQIEEFKMPEMNSSPESHVQFQYEVIRSLGESVREMARVMAGVQTTQVDILVRLARIEANRVNEDVVKLASTVEALDKRIDTVEKHDTYEAGMRGARKALIFYWPAIAAVGCLVLFLLVATGTLVIPSTQKPPIVLAAPPIIQKGDSP